LGWFVFRPLKDHSCAVVELGYRLGRAAWGRGLATEGSLALIRKGFTELGVERVTANTMTVNARSRRVMEKAGLTCVRTFSQEWPDVIEGSELGDVEYTLTRADWELRGRRAPQALWLESSQPLDHLPEDLLVGQLSGRHGPAHPDVARFEQIAEDDAYDADGQVGVGGQLRDGLGLGAAESEQCAVFGAEEGFLGGAGCVGLDDDERDEVEAYVARARLGPSAGHRVRADQRAGFGVVPLAAADVGHGDHVAMMRGGVRRCSPTRLTRRAIS
jgi:hypothetical protein